MDIEQALKWADVWGRVESSPPNGDAIAMLSLAAEVLRLREGLRLITCEPINAEYMAQNILDGLPAYHDTMLVPNETPNAEVTGAPHHEPNKE